eukprot:6794587-Prymnesium_polylepis.1
MSVLTLCVVRRQTTPLPHFSTVRTRPGPPHPIRWSGLEFLRRANAVAPPSALHTSYAHLSRAVV